VVLSAGWRLTAEWVAGNALPTDLTQTPPWEAYLAVSPTAVLRLRGRLPGERFVPLGMAGHTVKLKEMMINRKIPAALRRRWPLVVDDMGVLWLSGLAQADRTAVRPDTPTVLKLTLHAPTKPPDSGENLS
ncbi:MAG: tRNA lysidine(34) synthetase TilS, partial [Anaerolineales bacterium]|nr:tRNA lysidine(34) synthetase TilS [Anaerolineales bacterium]